MINNSRRVLALAGLGLAALLFTPFLQTQVRAQGPQGNGGGLGGGPGNRRPPFAFGTVTAVDAGAGTITLSLQFGGGTQTIQTQGVTQITTQVAAKVSELKVGDQIQVQGVPTGITASSLTIGQSPFPTGGPGAGPGGPGAGPGGPGGGPQPGSGVPAPSYATASGTITATSPLTISLSPTASLTLKMDAGAKVTRYSTLALSGIKVGDRVMGLGTTGDDGTFTATTVAVNVNMGGQGGGFGGRGFGGRGRSGFSGRNGGPGGGQGGPQGGGPPPPAGDPGPPPPAQ